jgi:hypothetical protein
MKNTYTLYDNNKQTIVDDEITIDSFCDFYLESKAAEKLYEKPYQHRVSSFRRLMKSNERRGKNFTFENFEFLKN